MTDHKGYGQPEVAAGVHSPWRSLLLIVGTTAVCELGVMAILDRLGVTDPLIGGLLDAAALSAVVFAVVHFLVLRPLLALTEAFRASERRLYGYARTASDWFWGLDADLRFSHLSEGFAEATGLAAETLLGKNWHDVGVLVDDEGSLEEHLATLAERKPFRNFHFAVREASGDIQWFSVTGQPLFTDSGRFLGYFGTGNDITLDKYGALELKRSKALVDGILRTTLDGFLVLSAVRSSAGQIVDFRFVHANQRAGEIVGRARQDLLGKLFHRELPWMEDCRFTEHAIHAIETGKPFDLEHRFDYAGAHGWYRIVGVKAEDGVVITVSDITSLKVAEQSLREAIESIPEAFALWDAEDRLEICNSNFRHFHAAVADVIEPGQTYGDICTLATERGQFVIQGAPEAWIAQRLALEHVTANPTEQQLADGRWARISARKTADHRTVSIHSDITDLKQRERALLESQALLAEAQRIGHLGWWTLDIGRGRLRWSDEVFRIFGRDPAGPTPSFEDMIAAIPPDDRPLVKAAIDLSLKDGTPFTLEHRIDRPGASQRIVHVKGEVKPDHARGDVRLLATILDITDRKHIEEELRGSEERYTLAVAGSNEGVWDWDVARDKLYVSPRFKELLGYADDEAWVFTRDTLAARIDPQHKEKYTSRLAEHLAGEAPYFSCEYLARTKSGAYRWFLERGLALRDAQGHPYRMAGSITDVTERRKAEDRLLHTQKMEALGQLAGGVAHEFNNLLTGIIGFAHMARKKPEDAERVITCLDEIITSAERSSDIARQLLRFGRRDENEDVLTPSTPRPIFPSTVIMGMRKMLEPLIGKAVHLSFSLADETSACNIEPGQLAQVILNLAVNARDAMPSGGEITIGLRVVAADAPEVVKTGHIVTVPQVLITVADQGQGIDDKTLKRIFEPFFSTKEPGKGTGLGLSITYGIVDAAGGFIDVDSVVGHGTRFLIFLPVSLESPVEQPPAPTADEGQHCGTATIMVVDDEKSVRALTCATLAELGYNVLEAGDGVEAMERQNEYPQGIDLLLSDVVMPRMGGMELGRAFAEVRPSTTVIYMSGYPDREVAGATEKLSEGMLLPKPFTPEQLAAFVSRALDKECIPQ